VPLVSGHWLFAPQERLNLGHQFMYTRPSPTTI